MVVGNQTIRSIAAPSGTAVARIIIRLWKPESARRALTQARAALNSVNVQMTSSLLRSPELRQLDQRISLKAMLQPLDRDDVQQYVGHRLTVAGESVSVVFEKNAIKRLHTLSGGVPRIINLLCDRALMAGADRGVHEITSGMIDQAADAISFRRAAADVDRPQRQRRRLPAIGVAAVVVIGSNAAVSRLRLVKLAL